MNYWDSSALVSLVIKEESSETLDALLENAQHSVTWYFTPVEVFSALCGFLRRRSMMLDTISRYLPVWGELSDSLNFIEDVEIVRQRAIRVVQTHPLKAADALQLAAALVACADLPEAHLFVTLDRPLGEAARKEGFRVCP